MTDYVRILSYMYLYDNDKKLNNVGFVKIDGRNETAKIHLNVRMPYENELRKLSLIVYNEVDGEIIATVLDELKMINGAIEYRTQVRLQDVINSIGIKVCTDDGEDLIFASYFKDTEVNILEIKAKDTLEETEIEPINNIDIETESIETCSCGCEEPDFFEKISNKYCKCKVLGNDYECIRICGKDVLLIKCLLDDTYYIGLPK